MLQTSPAHVHRVVLAAALFAALVSAACGEGTDAPERADDGAAPPTSAGAGASDEGSSSSDAASSGSSGAGAGGSSAGAGGSGAGGAPSTGDAAAWIAAELADVPLLSGDFTTRQSVETPVLVKDATGCCSKYSFDLLEEEAPTDTRVGFVHVTISDLESSDAWGGGFVTAHAPDATVFLADVHIEPNWPTWQSYDTTNKDGMVLDGAAAIYGEDVTVSHWNADAAIDNKAGVSQFVRLQIVGEGNRGIRYWQPGPHYLVESTLENAGGLGEGSVLWFKDCATVTLRVYESTFNGSATVPPGVVSCDSGSDPNIEYLTTDPRTTGEMHEMFSTGAVRP